ncbi:response regulator transcription factor [Aeromicrobium sp. Marseille-Q0843]|uniref:Response regulator transcription factor n=1 Tax=Aeromicrobium phoceense TaxID=2754045 RepID=A0A838XKY5_9ACTN|nr:response regulator transcription factor [Aeromicrobium phoceense]MBA4609276.1 response regulator transcription factor [Aeromicrobium phoceense]
MSVRVLIVDDHPLMRAALCALFETEGTIEVVAAVGTTAEALDEARRSRPDVVLMDLQFNGVFEGARATREIRGLAEPPAVLVLTNFDTDADIIEAIEAGAAGYLLKDAAPEEITAAIHAAAAGQTALSPSVATRLLARMQQPRTSLSVRELEVLNLVAAGHSNTDIARRLHLSETTVKSHLAHVYPKLGVNSRTAAVAEARRRGVIGRA